MQRPGQPKLRISGLVCYQCMPPPPHVVCVTVCVRVCEWVWEGVGGVGVCVCVCVLGEGEEPHLLLYNGQKNILHCLIVRVEFNMQKPKIN